MIPPHKSKNLPSYQATPSAYERNLLTNNPMQPQVNPPYIRTIEEMIADPEDKLVIDVRRFEDFREETYPGAIHIFIEELFSRREELPKDGRHIYLLCYSGRNSEEVAKDLQQEGYLIYSIQDGYYSYIRLRMRDLLQKEEATTRKCKEIERSIIKRFRREIWSRFTRAINTYQLIQDGDKLAVCISGGKDSFLMAKLFQELHRHGKQNFEVVYLVMNPGYNETNYQAILDNAQLMNVPITVFTSEIFDIVAGEGEASPCYHCARMRRGALYHKAKELGCNKIALGHHYDDVIETILMGMLYGGQVQTMMPKLHSTNFPGMELIRPLYLIREDDIKRFRDSNQLRFIACACRLTESCASCGGTDRGSKRAEIKNLIRHLHEQNPYVEANIFKSVENVSLNTIIEYKTGDGKRHNFLDQYD